MLGFPPEAADALAPGSHIDDPRRSAADAVIVEVVGVFEAQECFVGNRLDQPGAEQRNRHPLGDNVRFRRNDRLAGVVGDRKDVEQRAAPEHFEIAFFVESARPHFRHRTDASDRR